MTTTLDVAAFIALVKDNERFDYLVKREKLLEQLL